MFVNNEITDRGLLHKLLRKATSEVTMDEREVWARVRRRSTQGRHEPVDDGA